MPANRQGMPKRLEPPSGLEEIGAGDGKASWSRQKRRRVDRRRLHVPRFRQVGPACQRL